MDNPPYRALITRGLMWPQGFSTVDRDWDFHFVLWKYPHSRGMMIHIPAPVEHHFSEGYYCRLGARLGCPGNEVLATGRENHGKTRGNKHGEHTLSCLGLLRWIPFGICSVAAQRRCHQPEAVHNGSKFGRRSAGSSVSTDWTRCTFLFQSVLIEVEDSSWWGHFIRSEARVDNTRPLRTTLVWMPRSTNEYLTK